MQMFRIQLFSWPIKFLGFILRLVTYSQIIGLYSDIDCSWPMVLQLYFEVAFAQMMSTNPDQSKSGVAVVLQGCLCTDDWSVRGCTRSVECR